MRGERSVPEILSDSGDSRGQSNAVPDSGLDLAGRDALRPAIVGLAARGPLDRAHGVHLARHLIARDLRAAVLLDRVERR